MIAAWCATCGASEVFAVARSVALSALAEAEAAGLAPRLQAASRVM
jgi:hypothetical protein